MVLSLPARLAGSLFFLLMLIPAAGAVEYANPSSWLHISDGSLPVDVIYLYPTTWQPEAGEERMYCDIDDASMTAGAADVYSRQATAFEPVANVYAPFYRQFNIDKTLGIMEHDQLMDIAAGIPATDFKDSLDCYFANFNQGRPFILAGHSQGTMVLLSAMADYFREHPELKDRMVASYLIGYSVTDDFLSAGDFAFASGADDTGVVVSWNTEAPGTVGNPVLLPGAIAINPLNWQRDGTYAGTDQNLGSLMAGPDDIYRLVPGVADAYVDPETGALLTDIDPSLVPALDPRWPAGCCHGQDYHFYYMNIMQNALHRSLVFLNRPQAALYTAAARAGTVASRSFARAVPSIRDDILGSSGFVTGIDGDYLNASVDRTDSHALASLRHDGLGGTEVFASPFGSWLKQRRHNGYAGYDIDGGGIAVGAKKRLGDFTLGLAAGYSRQKTEMADVLGRVEADMAHAALFMNYRRQDLFIEGMAGYGRAWNDARRTTPYGTLGAYEYAAKYRDDIWSARLGIGYIADLPGRVRLVPSVGVDAVWVRSDGFSESGDLAAMQTDALRYASVEVPVSVLAEKRFSTETGKTVAPWLEAAWIPEIGDRRPAATVRFAGTSAAGSFRAASAAVRSRGRAAAGLKADVGRVAVNVGYTFEFAGSYRNHSLGASVGIGF
ncbi:MAG: autotransporter domain-containing protein [Planctomycetaceae bacterium]|nr:autotransporter domain-containing protein [Planctomycetaceae bacterium]